MPSYKITPIPEEKLNTKSIEETIERNSARDSDHEFRRGTIPESFERLRDDRLWFEYAIEEEVEYETLDEVKTEKLPERYPIAFLGDRFIAIANCTNNVEQEILSFLEDHFVPGISLETLEFEERTLRQIIDEAPEVIKANVEPAKASKADQVSGTDRRGLRKTEFWRRYQGDPISKIKVNLPSADDEVRVGFDKYGVVVLHEQTLTIPQQVEVLNSLADSVISEYVSIETFQSKLGGNPE